MTNTKFFIITADDYHDLENQQLLQMLKQMDDPILKSSNSLKIDDYLVWDSPVKNKKHQNKKDTWKIEQLNFMHGEYVGLVYHTSITGKLDLVRNFTHIQNAYVLYIDYIFHQQKKKNIKFTDVFNAMYTDEDEAKNLKEYFLVWESLHEKIILKENLSHLDEYKIPLKQQKI